MIVNKKPYCDVCRREMLRRTHNNDGETLCPWRRAEAHVCNECFSRQWDVAWAQDQPCRQCETRPCKKGRDCWYTPAFLRNLPHETYWGECVEDATPTTVCVEEMRTVCQACLTDDDGNCAILETAEITETACEWTIQDGVPTCTAFLNESIQFQTAQRTLEAQGQLRFPV